VSKVPYSEENDAENFNRLSRVHQRYRRQTDRRQTDGPAIAYSEREREFTFAKNNQHFLLLLLSLFRRAILITVCAGKTRIGSGRASVRQDIVLQGAAIHDQHCFIVNDDVDDVVTLQPLTGHVSVDGQLITTPTKLVQGPQSFVADNFVD